MQAAGLLDRGAAPASLFDGSSSSQLSLSDDDDCRGGGGGGSCCQELAFEEGQLLGLASELEALAAQLNQVGVMCVCGGCCPERQQDWSSPVHALLLA